MPGLGVGIGVGRVGKKAYPPYYVNSSTGNDSNAGTASAPLLTLAAAQAKPGAASRGVSLSGTFLEELTVPGKSTPGQVAVIDGSSPATTWTAQGTANCWQITGWTHDISNGRIVVYENDVPMTPVADVATCSTTAGSYVKMVNPGSPVTVVIHATGDGNPNSNGKTYRITKRNFCYNGPANGKASNLNLLRAGVNDGSLRSLYDGTYADRLLIEWGGKHLGVLKSGTVNRCIFISNDTPPTGESSGIYYTSFADDPTGLVTNFRRSGLLGLGRSGNGLPRSLYAHGNPNPYGTFNIFGAWAANLYADGLPGSTADSVDGYYSYNCFSFPSDAINNYQTPIRRLQVVCPGTNTTINTLKKVDYTDCTFMLFERTTVGNGGEIWSPQGDYSFQNCATAGMVPVSGGYTNLFANPANAANVSINKTIFDGGGTLIWLGASLNYIGNYNVFHATNYFTPSAKFIGYAADGTQCSTLAAWQAKTGQDLQSVIFLDADQSGANKFWLNSPTSGNDWTINPVAKVYDSSGNAYIGTFPDGTPLTSAGPQTRHNFTLGITETGPPVGAPNVPLTRAQAVAWLAG